MSTSPLLPPPLLPSTCNINIGVLGHVDSGKTSLVAALSTTLSTAALDKHPQSKERGITLDLGFSSFTLPLPPTPTHTSYDAIQFTLVDCPGHASLIRTVVGGAHIMDFMILVIDVTKGIQTQTAECIVIGEITTDKMIVVLNKVDLIAADKQEKYVRKAKKMVAQTLRATKFANAPMVAVSCRQVHPDHEDRDTAYMDALKQTLLDTALEVIKHTKINSTTATATSTSTTNPFLLYIDHCFMIKGQGTVLTGTVGRGRLHVGDTIELPALKQQRKVKSMQVFRKPVNECKKGDRVGVCVTQLDAEAVERGVACHPGTVPTFQRAIVRVQKVRFYPGDVRSKSKMHIIVGHDTRMATCTFFSCFSSTGTSGTDVFDFEKEYAYEEELVPCASQANVDRSSSSGDPPPPPTHEKPEKSIFALMEFAEPVTAPPDSLVIGARLDTDLHASACRIALYGHMVAALPPTSSSSSPYNALPLKVYKIKKRQGSVERIEGDGRTAICKGMFGKDSDLSKFIGLRVTTVGPGSGGGGGGGGVVGRLESSFGKSGKCKVKFNHSSSSDVSVGSPVVVEYKKYVLGGGGGVRKLAQ